MPRDPRLAAVVIPDGALLFEASVPISVFGVDRRSTGGPELRVTVATPGGTDRASTTAGLSLSGLRGLEVLDEAGVVILPSWPQPAMEPPDDLLGAVRSAYEAGATLMGLCLGAYVLAYAGLLDGRRALTHWHWMSDFQQRFPEVRLHQSSLYVDEGRIITSAGTAAGLDACLHYVRREWGANAASAIARRMVVAPHRPGSQNQFIEPEVSAGTEPSIAAVQARALESLNTAVEIDQLAGWYGTSRRTFDRDFRAAAGQSPLQWLIHQRVLLAQRLLETSDLSVEAIAHSVGFTSAMAMRPSFRRHLGVTPSQYRESFHSGPQNETP